MSTTEKAIIKEPEFMAGEFYELALELHRENKLAEARRVLTLALAECDDVDQKLSYRNLMGMVERAEGNYYEALRLHVETYPLSQLSSYHRLRANFHNGLGITYEGIAAKEGIAAYFGKALVEYEAARYHLEEAGEAQAAGYVENNVGVVLGQLGRTTEAREHLQRARDYCRELPVILAEIDETEAQLFLREGKPLAALALTIDANRVFIQHGEKRLLDDSLRTLMKAAADYLASSD